MVSCASWWVADLTAHWSVTTTLEAMVMIVDQLDSDVRAHMSAEKLSALLTGGTAQAVMSEIKLDTIFSRVRCVGGSCSIR